MGNQNQDCILILRSLHNKMTLNIHKLPFISHLEIKSNFPKCKLAIYHCIMYVITLYHNHLYHELYMFLKITIYGNKWIINYYLAKIMNQNLDLEPYVWQIINFFYLRGMPPSLNNLALYILLLYCVFVFCLWINVCISLF